MRNTSHHSRFIPRPHADVSCQTWPLSPIGKTLLSAMLFVGMYLGSMTVHPLPRAPHTLHTHVLQVGYISDHYGRRPGVLLSTSCVTFFGLASVVAPNYWLLIIARFGVGYGIGSKPVVITCLSEILPTKLRSVMSSGQQQSKTDLLH